MSGPKTSRYTLTPEQRRILEEQRKLQQRIEAAKAITQANNKKITELLETAKEGKKTAALLKRNNGCLCGGEAGGSERQARAAAFGQRPSGNPRCG